MITVFTPTYNRAYRLPQLYRSLQAQTVQNFEWLIIDDGSTDNTADLVQHWQGEKNAFPIRYSKVSNGGKHRAVNKGAQLAQGEVFFIVDSDDALPPDTMSKIQTVFEQVRGDERFAGVSGLKADIKTGKALGNCAAMPPLDASMIDIRQKYGIRGDMAEAFKTAILRQYPFPEFEGENFINEAVVWNKMAAHYILRYVPQVWYLCEYLPDGLTSNIRRKYRNNPQGTVCLLRGILTSSAFGLKRKVRAAVLYWRYLCMQKTGYRKAVWWTYAVWPLGVAVYLYDRIKGR